MLKRVRPECREEDLYWLYHMMSGAISLSFAETGRIDTLSNGRCKSADLDTIFDRMASIFGAGLDGLAGAGGPAAEQTPTQARSGSQQLTGSIGGSSGECAPQASAEP